MLGLAGFEHLRALVEVAGLDGLHEGRDHPGDGLALGRRDQAVGECGGDRSHRPGDIGRTLDRGQCELNRAIARRPRTCSSGFSSTSSTIGTSFALATPIRRRDQPLLHANGSILWMPNS